MNGLTAATCVVVLSVCGAPPEPSQAGNSTENDRVAHLAAICDQATQDAIKDTWASCNLQAKRATAARRARIHPDAQQELHDDGTFTFASVQRKREAIEALENAVQRDKVELDAMRKPDAIVTPFLPPALSLGDVGRVAGPATIVKILDGRNVIVSGTIGAARERSPGAAPQQWRTGNDTVWISGRSTAGLAPGQPWPASQSEMLEVVGNVASPQAGGEPTIYQLKPIDLAPVRAALVTLRRQSHRFRLAMFGKP